MSVRAPAVSASAAAPTAPTATTAAAATAAGDGGALPLLHLRRAAASDDFEEIEFGAKVSSQKKALYNAMIEKTTDSFSMPDVQRLLDLVDLSLHTTGLADGTSMAHFLYALNPASNVRRQVGFMLMEFKSKDKYEPSSLVWQGIGARKNVKAEIEPILKTLVALERLNELAANLGGKHQRYMDFLFDAAAFVREFNQVNFDFIGRKGYDTLKNIDLDIVETYRDVDIATHDWMPPKPPKKRPGVHKA